MPVYYLDGSWAQGEQLVTGTLGIAVHVDQDVNSILVDPVCSFAVAGNLIRKSKTGNVSDVIRTAHKTKAMLLSLHVLTWERSVK